MAEFGRRNAGRSGPGAARPGGSPAEATQADLAAAAEVVAAGKLPAWTNVGRGQILLAVAFFAALYLFFASLYAGALIRDHRLAGSWQAAYDMQAEDGRCARHWFLLTTCSARIVSLAEPGAAPIRIEFMMGFVGGGGELLVPVRSTADPSAVTLAYAAETELANRTLTFAVMTLFLLAICGAGLAKLRQGRYRDSARHRQLLAGLALLQARMEAAPAEQRAAA